MPKFKNPVKKRNPYGVKNPLFHTRVVPNHKDAEPLCDCGKPMINCTVCYADPDEDE